uniref:small monomeric GTPase n=2 Tax=Canis lupus familiaris TaxID=9615 RepID=A0A8P0TM96_CANLF
MDLENEASCSPSRAAGGSREYKVVMLGAGGVGKSAMTMQFISHQFPDYHDPTIEDAYKTQVRIDNEPAYLDILDTAGQAEFTAMREQYMRGGEGFIICYSVTDRQSFQEAAKFKELIFQVRHTYEIPLVLVGNKIDLEQFRQDNHAAAQFPTIPQAQAPKTEQETSAVPSAPPIPLLSVYQTLMSLNLKWWLYKSLLSERY